MEIRIRETGAVVYEAEFRAMHPNTSMPQQLSAELLDSLGADPVFEGPQATGGTVYQYSQRDGVEQIDGKWYTKYVLGPVFDTPAEEAAYQAQVDAAKAAQVRSERNAKLAETDWTQGKDIPDVVSAQWAVYRQALRDVPAQPGFPWDVQWPVSPL